MSSGVKSILDAARTLEMLETLGVPVIGFRTDRFPGFYLRDSGLPVPYRADTFEELDALIDSHWSACLPTGVLVANPIPAENEADPVLMQYSIDHALDAARSGGVAGKELSPFLLERVATTSEGASLGANAALARSNAAIAGGLAAALSAIRVA